MLTDFLSRIKSFLKSNQRDLYLAALVFLMGVASFGLGRLSVIWPEKEPITVANDEGLKTNANPSNPRAASGLSSFGVRPSSFGNYVASKNGSSYHLPDCPGAKQIKDENKVWFQTKEDAVKAGYKPAGNCPGL